MLAEHFDLALIGGTCVIETPRGALKEEQLDLGISQGKISYLGQIASHKADKIISCQGLHILPGLIDSQVHFRDPGMEHKEDLGTGTAGAVLGGITSIFDMPNTKPPTTNALNFSDKITRAKNKAWCNFAFYVGASPDNIEKLSDLEKLPGCCGTKIFMGSSTGDLLVEEDEIIEQVLKHTQRTVSAHCEDENRLKQRFELVNTDEPGDVHKHPVWRDEETALLATQRLLSIAEKLGRQVHILHVTTKQEMQLLKTKKQVASVEVTPQHLTLFAPDCYDRLGNLAQMNPPIRSLDHQEALWAGINDGTVDVLGSDHAPHTREEKSQNYPSSPSGMTGVQTTLPVMLNHVANGRLSLLKLVELLAKNPARRFGMANKGSIQVNGDADLTLIDTQAKREIKNSWIASRCGWTPYDGMHVTGWPVSTLIHGHITMRDDQVLGSPRGQTIEFCK